MAKKIVLEFQFTFLQKLVLLISVAVLLLMIMSYIIDIIGLTNLLLLCTFVLCYPILIILAFTKKGFLVENGRFFKSYFFMGFCFYKSEIDIFKYSKVAILKFKKSRKLPWFSIAQPDAATDYKSFEINILNDSHTQRKIIIELKKQKNVEPVINFLTTNTDLVYEKYKPKTRRKRRG